ncbi:MAG: hypothetical protein PHC51_12585 [bacterium]|nr:hypothetical protein [bacterium]
MSKAQLTNSAISRLLERLERYDFTGEVVFSCAGDHGKIYMNNGQIAWAFASGQTDSFQALLIKEQRMPRETLSAGIQNAREKHLRCLGAMLKEIGISEPEIRKLIIERQTKAAIQKITSWKNPQASIQVSPPFAEGCEFIFPATRFIAIEHDVKHILSPEIETHKILEEVFNHNSNILLLILSETDTAFPINSFSRDENFNIDTCSAQYSHLFRSSELILEAAHEEFRTNNPLTQISVRAHNKSLLITATSSGKNTLSVLYDEAKDEALLSRISIEAAKKI